MKLNERGSSLVTVLMVVLIFSVLGLALMGNVVNENKRVMATESDVQARYLAENGLTYFEIKFKNSLSSLKNQIKDRVKTQTDPNIVQISDLSKYILEEFVKLYQIDVPVGDTSNPNETKIRAELVTNSGEQLIKVTSTGTAGSKVKRLIGYYKPNISIDFDTPTMKIADFTGRAIDFSDYGAASLNLISAVSLDLIKFDITKDENHFYNVPDDEILKVNLLSSLGLSIGAGNRFQTMEKYPVLVTRKDTLLGASILNLRDYPLVSVNLITYENDSSTNVIIDGSYKIFQAGNFAAFGYQDIAFKKLAVMGNAIIQQDRYKENDLGYVDNGDKNNQLRFFSFDEGLYVDKSLVIGDSKGGDGNLKLQGDIVVKGNLLIKDINLIMGAKKGNEAIYVYGDVTINNACLSSEPDSYQARIFAKGQITINNDKDCNKYNIVFYSDKGIQINTKNDSMMIKGGLIGDVKFDNKDKVQFAEKNAQYLDMLDFKGFLKPKGRTY